MNFKCKCNSEDFNHSLNYFECKSCQTRYFVRGKNLFFLEGKNTEKVNWNTEYLNKQGFNLLNEFTEKNSLGGSDKKTSKHESYGIVSISKLTGNKSTPLFGSSILHSSLMRIRVSKASVSRHLNTDWYHAEGSPIIEFDLSWSQFVEMIMSVNQGDGVPCTLKYIDSVKMSEPFYTNKRQQFDEEFEKSVQKVSNILDQTIKLAQALCDKKSVSKKDRENLLHEIKLAKQSISSSIPFVKNQFSEQMDKTVTEAKGEIDGFITTIVFKYGEETLKQLTGGSKEILIDREPTE